MQRKHEKKQEQKKGLFNPFVKPMQRKHEKKQEQKKGYHKYP